MPPVRLDLNQPVPDGAVDATCRQIDLAVGTVVDPVVVRYWADHPDERVPAHLLTRATRRWPTVGATAPGLVLERVRREVTATGEIWTPLMDALAVYNAELPWVPSNSGVGTDVALGAYVSSPTTTASNLRALLGSRSPLVHQLVFAQGHHVTRAMIEFQAARSIDVMTAVARHPNIPAPYAAALRDWCGTTVRASGDRQASDVLDVVAALSTATRDLPFPEGDPAWEAMLAGVRHTPGSLLPLLRRLRHIPTPVLDQMVASLPEGAMQGDLAVEILRHPMGSAQWNARAVAGLSEQQSYAVWFLLDETMLRQSVLVSLLDVPWVLRNTNAIDRMVRHPASGPDLWVRLAEKGQGAAVAAYPRALLEPSVRAALRRGRGRTVLHAVTCASDATDFSASLHRLATLYPETALDCLATFGDRHGGVAPETLARLAQSPHAGVREAALRALGTVTLAPPLTPAPPRRGRR